MSVPSWNMFSVSSTFTLLFTLSVIFSSVSVSMSSADNLLSAGASNKIRHKRHTPFLPDDHWKGPPEFGPTKTDRKVMVNGTIDLVCPIGHVQDSAVSPDKTYPYIERCLPRLDLIT